MRQRENPAGGVGGASGNAVHATKLNAPEDKALTTAAQAPLPFHPLAEIFPLIEGYEFAGLVDDIRANGLREPVVLLQGQILDGRNRYRACATAGVACRFENYTGNDPLGYVISLNLRRRHLDESQRAMVAAKIATLRDGQRQVGKFADVPTQGRAASLLNVSERTVRHARDVVEHGVPELRQAVERGEVSVSAAADVATMALEAQRELLAQCDKREVLEAAKQIRADKAEVRRAERIERICSISNGNVALPSDRKYPVILADPPWHFEVYNEDSGVERAAATHYPTMLLSEICKLPIPNLATPDAILFLWTTTPHLREAFNVMDAWGFKYASNTVWVKDKIGLGYWVRNQHELLLIGKRGDMPTPPPACRPPSVIQAPAREHSRKPDEAYELIERMYPELPKIELFARDKREGWAAWGNEAPAAVQEDDPFALPGFLRRGGAP
jgi:N6-adenosine-specific RNA methylase IME4